MKEKTLEFPDGGGITNGAEWYVLYGGMQDWNYLALGDFEITVELSFDKTPRSSQLEKFFQYNRESMISYIEHVHTGVRGTLHKNGSPVSGNVTIVGINSVVSSDPETGDYFRPLPEGTHIIKASIADADEQERTIYIPPFTPYSYTVVNFNFT